MLIKFHFITAKSEKYILYTLRIKRKTPLYQLPGHISPGGNPGEKNSKFGKI